MQSTGEAKTLEQLDDVDGDLVEFVSTAKYVEIYYELYLDQKLCVFLRSVLGVSNQRFESLNGTTNCYRGVLQTIIEKYFPGGEVASSVWKTSSSAVTSMYSISYGVF